ncbi:putative uncharacterized protein [Clostridium sp. CAG:590]|nr:putative uncharacterized protein [Clostridium sp. CAG:590]
MITLIFIILMIMVFGKLLIWSIKAAWGITKILFTVVFLPIILIALALSGAIYIAIVLLIIGGIVTLVKSATE